QRMQQVLSGICALILTQQNRRFVRVQFEFDRVLYLGAGAEKRFNDGAVVSSIQPFVVDLESEFGESRSVLDQIDCSEKFVAIYSVNDRCVGECCGCHNVLSFLFEFSSVSTKRTGRARAPASITAGV